MAKLWRRFSNWIIENSIRISFRAMKRKTVGQKGSHSWATTVQMGTIQIKILPALKDNYMYLIIDSETRDAAVVDPVEPDKVIQTAIDENCNLTKVLTTHHHWDHSGGNRKLVRKLQDTPIAVYGGDDRIGGLTNFVVHDEQFKIGNLNVTCLHTPYHTAGHICYYIESAEGDKAVFTGDTLFQGGCGAFFEGNNADMVKSLCIVLCALPDSTKVFCGHEYTLGCLKFAKYIEPENEHILKRIEWAAQRRVEHKPTVPSTIGEEKQFNPFMRINTNEIQERVKETDPVKIVRGLRKEMRRYRRHQLKQRRRNISNNRNHINFRHRPLRKLWPFARPAPIRLPMIKPTHKQDLIQ